MAALADFEKATTQLHETATKSEEADVVNAVHLAEEAAGARYDPLTHGLLRLYGCLLIAYLCGCLNGYDGSLMGGLNAMTSYQQYFHM